MKYKDLSEKERDFILKNFETTCKEEPKNEKELDLFLNTIRGQKLLLFFSKECLIKDIKRSLRVGSK